MSFNVKLARQKLPGLSMTDKIELAHLALDEIEALQAQLAARNQAAEAMGVLEWLAKETPFAIEIIHFDECNDWEVLTRYGSTISPTLIEAVLKAGGEG